MMNVLIIEDEEIAFKSLKDLLLEVEPNINVVDRLQSVEESILWFESHALPDLILLDIQLSDDLSFKIFETVKVNCPIIFTTAFDEFAIKAFELNSIDYLLKPITKPNLQKALTKFQTRVQPSVPGYQQLLQDLNSLSNSPTYKERFLVNKADELLIIPTSKIAYFFKDNNTCVVLQNGQQFPVKYTLDQLGDLLDPSQFYRVNRQLVVSIQSIAKVVVWFKGKLKLQLAPTFNDTVLVSKEKASDFKKWLDR